jgi:hypothetical protein
VRRSTSAADVREKQDEQLDAVQRITASAGIMLIPTRNIGLERCAKVPFAPNRNSPALSSNLSTSHHRSTLYFVVSTAISVRGGDMLG